MQDNNKIPVIVIVGPTASGKTKLSVMLAKALDAEILSFDSMQIYRGMDIATAKPSVEEMQGIPHHMIGVIPNDKSFSVAKYKEMADEIIDGINARGHRVIMVGGTGLYADAVLQNLELLEAPDTTEIRESLKKELSEVGPVKMHEKLQEIDPEAAKKIHPNNTGRVIRALEVYYSTGHTMTYQVENSKKVPSRYVPFYIGLTAENRDFLYERINKRVDLMLENGLLEEAKDFKASLDKNLKATANQAIGIKELMPYLNGESTLESCVEHLKQETRRYAKRQLTWFRRNKDVHWLYIDRGLNDNELLNEALGLLKDFKAMEE